jgi:LDH2 family malate/lactate/ureidoglycolate dehydrogenase
MDLSRDVENAYRRTSDVRLTAFVVRALTATGVSADDAATVAEILVAADMRGVESHGVARLASFYVDRLRAGTTATTPSVTV